LLSHELPLIKFLHLVNCLLPFILLFS
jgi:hypothetical protein